MEKEVVSQSGQNAKNRSYEAEKKAQQRAKQKAIKEGSYVVPLIEQAKVDLKDKFNFDLAALLLDEKFKENQDEQFIKQLKIFLQNQKQKQKKDNVEVIGKEKQQVDIKEKAQRLGNQQIPLLHQSLLNPQTKEERKCHITSLINDNLYLFLNYMEGYLPPTEDFLSIILELFYEFDQDTSTKLFVRVCSMHRGEILVIDKNMVSSAMLFLIQSKVDNIAAFGLLRLLFQNDISLFDFPVQLLQDFQSMYEQTIQNFYKSIPKLRFQLNELLPATCFCFTAPLIKSLKEGNDILHRQVPYQFMPYLLEIICYSFTDNEIVFDKFLNTFKFGCMKLYDNLLQSDFENLLQELTDRTKSMQTQFFKSLANANDILERAFELLKERKIEKFDIITINSLLDSSSETFQIMKQRPKILKEGSKNQIEQIIQQLAQKNQEINLSFIKEENILSQNDKDLFNYMGIVNLLPVQEICFRFCSSFNQQKPHFIQYDTGQGKTSLCISLAFKRALNKKIVYVLNNSQNLLFRDFKKAQELQGKFDIQIMYLNEQNVNEQEHLDINYIELEAFQQYFAKKETLTLTNTILIIDEYDSIFFSGYEKVSNFIKIISQLKNIIAFSGTKLEQYHKNFIIQNIDSHIIDFSINQSIKVHQLCHEQVVYSNVVDYRKKIVNLCHSYTEKTPIILILKDQQTTIKNSLEKLKIPVQTLYDKNSQAIDSSLQIFNEKQGKLYGVFILNEDQGRGLDFISNSEIEQNGGIYLIIGCIPNYYLQYQQFIGRTGRIGNKGQYSVIIYDKEAKNNDGKVYLNKTLIRLKNNEILQIATIKGLHLKNENMNDKIFQIQEEQKQYYFDDSTLHKNEALNRQLQEYSRKEENHLKDLQNNDNNLDDSQLRSDNISQLCSQSKKQ